MSPNWYIHLDLDSDSYEQAVERAGVVELPEPGELDPPSEGLTDLLTGRFEDDEPPGAPR